MDRNVTIMQVGCGKMGKYLMRYALEKGADIVAAFDMSPRLVGKDISAVLGGEDRGVAISDMKDFEDVLRRNRPDCVVVATRSLLKDVKDVLLACARNGVNAVTTCDEALFPWNSSPALTREIHELAMENGCTITGAGFPDLSYCHLVAASCGAAHTITRITGSASYNVDDYGIALAEHHGAGYSAERFDREIASADRLSAEERQKRIDNGEFTPIPMWNANGWLCAKLGLTVKTQFQRCEPIFHDGDLPSRTLGRAIPKGDAIGMRSVAVTETEEGITLETESIGKVYAPGEEDTNTWVIHGEPDIHVANTTIKNTEMICSLMISRVVDAINGPAGFVTSNHFGPARYCAQPLNKYVNSERKQASEQSRSTRLSWRLKPRQSVRRVAVAGQAR